jgi:predicted phage terminase large subunit-like protein
MRTFLRLVFNTLHPGKDMLNNWHLDLMIEYLTAIESGNLQRLIVNLPPRSLKSICINVAWPAWLLGRSPNKRIIAVSYNQKLSEKHSIDCRTVIQSDWYKDMFPNTTLARGMNRTSKFCTTEGGFRFATSTGGTLTGEGADIIIIDDPTSASDAFSPKRRAKAYEWFRSCLLSRLNDCRSGKIVLVMQRLHSDDLTGMLLKSESRDLWKVLKIPAIATRDYTFSLGLFKYERKSGEHLFENAYYINSHGEKIFLKEKSSIKNLIKTQFSVDYNFLTTTMTCIKPRVVLNYKLPNHSLLSVKSYWHSNLFCDKNILSRYNYFYCQTAKMAVKSLNYDIVFEKIFTNCLLNKLDQKLNMNSINKDFNLLRREVGCNVFNVQYQQEATEALNSLIKAEWLCRYDDYEVASFSDISYIKQDPKAHDTAIFDYVYQSWDCAVKCGVKNDYSVCTTWGVRNHKLYLIHTLRAKIDYPKLRESIFLMSNYFNCDAILVEDCAAGQQIIQEISNTGCTINVIPIRPRYDKKTRLTLVSPLFERKIVMLPRQAPWLSNLVDELLNFPHTEHDDQVDSMSQFLLWYQKNEAKKHMLELNKLNLKLNCI